MRPGYYFILATSIALAGCANQPIISELHISPREAVMLAADAAPEGVPGRFEMIVVASGEQNGHGFLNSETDYRDQRNLTISINPRLRAFMTKNLNEDPISYYKGKHVVVRGQAQRVKIYFFAPDGRPTSKYYYQTHVDLRDPSDISVIDP